MIPLVLGRGIDIGQIFATVVFVIMIINWFVNVIKGNTPDGQPRPQKPRPKPQSGQSEIESLLQELSGGKPKPQPAPQLSKPQQQKGEFRSPKQQGDRPRPKQQQGKQKPSAASGGQTPRSSLRFADSKLPSTDLGSAVRTHHLANRVESAVEQDVTVAVQRDLGNRIAPALPTSEPQIHPLVKVLRDANGVRQAILLNEILQRPKSLRR